MNKKMNVVEFTISEGKKEKRIVIYHTLKSGGPINTIEAAIDAWSVRTENPTSEDFADYINSKRLKGMTLDFAYTPEQYETIKKLEESGSKQELDNYKHQLKKNNVYL